MIKILVSDPLSKEGVAVLQGIQEIDCNLKPGISKEELIGCIGEYEALIVRSETKVTKEVINAASKLRVIGRAGVGIDNIDVNAATQKGIVVMNTPDGNTISTAEHTMAMLLALSRSIPQAHSSLKGKVWDRKRFVGTELYGKTIGIIGLGRIGTQVAKRAQAFQMKIIAYDPFITETQATKLEITLVELKDLYQQANYISIHTPFSEETYHLIGEKEIAMMKDGVRIINCARGGIIDENALYEGLKSGKIAGCALDVFEKEPPLESPLLDLDQVVVVPHLGASTKEAQINVGVDIAQQIVDFLISGDIKNAVNMPTVDPQLLKTLAPYVELGEKIGKIHGQLAKTAVKKLRITYSGEIISHNITPISVSIIKGLLCTLLRDPGINYVNASSIAKERGIVILESKSSEITDFINLITVICTTDQAERLIAGTLLAEGESRIVKIDEFFIEAVPIGYLLILLQTDQPGIIGRIGTLIGNQKVNIGWMQLSRTNIGGKAVSVWNLDEDLPEAALEEIMQLPEILSAELVRL